MRKLFILAVLCLAVVGVFDASYLTFEHYSNSIPPCSTSIWVDCGRVLKSKYAMIGPLPLAVLGLAYYSTMVGLAVVRFSVLKEMGLKDVLWRIVEKYARPKSLTLQKMLFFAQLFFSTSAFLASLYFVYLQLAVIGAICLYCMFSAILSLMLWTVTLAEYFKVQRSVLE